MAKGVIIIILIFVVVLMAGLFFMQKQDTTDNNSGSEGGNLLVNQDKDVTGSETGGDVNNQETQTSEAGADGRGGGSDTGDTPILECETTEISYSLIDLNKTQICNENQSEICINKTIECYVKIQNREEQTSGFFEVELRFIEEGEDEDNPIEIKSSRFSLHPKGEEIFEETITIQSSGIDGIANKNINCFYNAIEVPLKCL